MCRVDFVTVAVVVLWAGMDEFVFVFEGKVIEVAFKEKYLAILFAAELSQALAEFFVRTVVESDPKFFHGDA